MRNFKILKVMMVWACNQAGKQGMHTELWWGNLLENIYLDSF
jgi:hypothetical protein